MFNKLASLDPIALSYLGYGKVAMIASSDIEKIVMITGSSIDLFVRK